MLSLAIFVPSSYGDWEKFQSVVDSVQELYEVDYLVYTTPHKLISLYAKIDCMLCGVNSIREIDKYDLALVFTSLKEKMQDTISFLCSSNKKTIVYDSFQDEIEVIQ